MEKENPFLNGPTHSWNSASSELNCFFNPVWENSMDQRDPFESALSSIVSSPVAVASSSTGEPVMIRELIGRLGNICHSSTEISPSHSSYINNNNNTRNGGTASIYSTPLNSPPKITDNHVSILSNSSVLPQFVGDPDFAERAARFSCFGSLNGQFGSELPKTDGREESSVSEQIPGGELSIKSKRNNDYYNGRKRKEIPRGKAKQSDLETDEVREAKRNKSEEEAKENEEQNEEENGDGKQKKAAAEAPKDYIHVRARRGQATDSHSLAERVRREKISERMRFLQDLVPGCSKVIGKAVMLDEIINYVQSLQRQVEFLSMKLATVNPRMEALMSNSKDIFQIPNGLYPPLMELDPYTSQPISITPSNPLHGFPNSVSSQGPALWEDDLQSVVQMGFGQNQQQSYFHGGSGHMKIESKFSYKRHL